MATTDLRTTPQQLRSGETIEAILDAAERVFAEKGTDNATTSDIAAEAQISVGRVYYWFSSKDAIIEALGDRSERLLRECFANVIATREEHGRFSSIERTLRGIVELARQNPSVKLILQGRSHGMLHSHRDLRTQFVVGSARTYAQMFPGTSNSEAMLIAETVVSLAWGSMSQLIAEDGDDLLREVVYATSSYLTCRFPPSDGEISDVVGRARIGDYSDGGPSALIRPVTYPEVDSTQ